MILRPYNPVSRYGVSPMPDDSVPVEIVRDSGAVMVAEWRGQLWYAGTKLVDVIVDRVAFWRYVE